MHTTGWLSAQADVTHELVFDIKPDDDVYWCTADIGWVTGHSLHRVRPAGQRRHLASCTRARPTSPTKDRLWAIIEKYRVTILYTAPTAIRTFMKWGPELPEHHDLSSLRLLGTVGEPINPEAWMWYRE